VATRFDRRVVAATADDDRILRVFLASLRPGVMFLAALRLCLKPSA
jgi:hypothetical protein